MGFQLGWDRTPAEQLARPSPQGSTGSLENAIVFRVKLSETHLWHAARLRRRRCLLGHAANGAFERDDQPAVSASTPEALEGAIERLEVLNRKATGRLPDGAKPKLLEPSPAAISAKLAAKAVSVSH